MFDAICLSSGGLDSVVCLKLLTRGGFRPLPLFINYGQLNLDREWQSLVANCERHQIHHPLRVEFPSFGDIFRTGLTDSSKRIVEDAFTPNRNLLFITLASSMAYTKGCRIIVIGLLAEESTIFPDQTDRFLSIATNAVNESLGHEVQIFCPLRKLTKSAVLQLADQIGVQGHYSCHAGTATPCGHCIACLEYK